jgi:hypothetical protein
MLEPEVNVIFISVKKNPNKFKAETRKRKA